MLRLTLNLYPYATSNSQSTLSSSASNVEASLQLTPDSKPIGASKGVSGDVLPADFTSDTLRCKSLFRLLSSNLVFLL